MSIQSVTTVLPAGDLRQAVEAWRTILGVEPAFIDGDRWAQFHVGAARIALAAGDQAAAASSLLIRTEELNAQRTRLENAGVAVSEIKTGSHEDYFEAEASQGWRATFYSPR